MALIDFQNRVNQEDQALADLIARRKAGIPGVLDQTRSDIESGRSQEFGQVLPSKLAGLGVTSPVDTSVQTGILGRSLDEVIGNQKYGMQRENINLAYNRALDRAINAGMNRRESENFARQVMQDEIRRQNEGAMNERQRQQTIRHQGIENAAFAQEKELQLSAIPNPMDEYQAAVIRIMTGLPTKLLTYYGLSGGFGNQATPTQGNYGGTNRTYADMLNSLFAAQDQSNAANQDQSNAANSYLSGIGKNRIGYPSFGGK